MMESLFILCILGAVLQLADYVTTRLAVERGLAHETNSILQRLMLAFGFRSVLIASKLLGVAVFVYLYVQSADWRIVAGLDALYLVVVFNNYRIANRGG